MKILAMLLCIWSVTTSAEPPMEPDDWTPNRLELDGDFVQGGLIFGETEPGVRVSVDGHPIRVSAGQMFVFGLDRDAADEVTLTLTKNGVLHTVRYPVAKRNYAIQKLNGLPPKQVNPDPEMDERIARESASNRAARARDTDLPGIFKKPFIWPAKGSITGVFGSQRIMNGEPKQPHYGVDVAGPVGAPVVAPADGIVSLANPDMFFSGGTLYIDHGYGVSSAFLHLSKILVKPGQLVKQGEKIALIGKTGRVTGAHLDWRVNWFESRVDATQLVPAISKGHTP